MRKYGIENFSFEVLEECTSDQLDAKEIAFIEQYNSYGDGGYNQDAGGWNAIHGKLTTDEVLEIHRLLSERKITMRQIAEKYDVHYNTIKTINNGTAWVLDGVKYPIRETPISLSEIQARINGNEHYVPVKKRIFNCPICGNTMATERAKMCKTCDEKRQRKVAERPSPLELAKMIKETSFTAVGKQFGVDGNTIKKWCKNYKIPYRIQELIVWYNNQMGIIELPKTPNVKGVAPPPKKVNQIDPNTNLVVATFDSCKSAARDLINKGSQATLSTIATNIGRVVSGKRKTCEGYIWELA